MSTSTKRPIEILWLVNGYEPFLPIDSRRSIEAWANNCPIIRDLTGQPLILTRREQYKEIFTK